MKKFLTILFVIILTQAVFSQQSDSAKIIGIIENHDAKKIEIGDDDVAVSDLGEFVFTTQMKYPNFFEVRYDQLYWLIYLEPGKSVKLTLQSSGLSSLIYEGDLKNSNNYLKMAGLLNSETNNFFNNNWVKIHTKKEMDFISVIDSLKQVFLKPLDEMQNEKISPEFIRFFKADVHFGFNTLILGYPDKYRRYTHKKVNLSQECFDYLNSVSFDDVRFKKLKSCQRYSKAWIDYHVNRLVEKNDEQKHSDLKKMDVLFDYLPTIFQEHELIDYWLAEYLDEHIKNTWLVNSELYIKKFNTICKTASYKKKINTYYDSCVDREKDHIVKVFKTINGYSLGAHIFYPDGIKPEKPTPTIIIFHGGGLVLGNPSWAFGRAKQYSDLGMIAVSAQYRLCNFKDVTPVQTIEDARDLMFWLRKNADSLGIMKDKIAAAGWSMGAQLCATLAILPDTLMNSEINSIPNALLLTSPGTNAGGWFTQLLAGAKVNPQDYSPINHVRSGLPPTLILQGREDTVTPLDDVQMFHDALIAEGNDSHLIIYDNVGHLFTPSHLDDSGWPRPDKEVKRQANSEEEIFLKVLKFY